MQVSFFHEFHKPPYGGGNQFLLALKKELESRGDLVLVNTVDQGSKACLFNSFNFDFDRLRKVRMEFPSIKMIHRVDGPIKVYRGFDDGTDQKIWEVNHELADVTVFQSEFSLRKHQDLGLHFSNPLVIPNSVNPEIFHSKGRIPACDGKRKTKLIAVSWSDNLKKGFKLYQELASRLPIRDYEFTFAGRAPFELKGIRHIPACPSEELAEILRNHDIYITASEDDPCSNSLIEALACGLPAVYLKSGGHAELVKEGGKGFLSTDEALEAIEEVSRNHFAYQSKIQIKTMKEISKKYLTLFSGLMDS